MGRVAVSCEFKLQYSDESAMADQACLDATFPLPQIQTSLTNYVKPREEVLRIRRILTVHFKANIPDPESGGNDTHIAWLSSKVTNHKTAPSEISGVYQDYLKALKTNRDVRKEFQKLEQAQHSYKRSTVDLHQQQDDLFKAHIALLAQRRRYEKLRILHDYLELLAQKPASDVKFLDQETIGRNNNGLPQPSLNLAERIGEGANSPKDNPAKELIGRLEKSVLYHKNLLGKEKAYLDTLQARRSSNQDQTFNGETPPETSKLHAIAQTRDDLITWIETELPTSSHSNGGDRHIVQGDSFSTSVHPIAESQFVNVQAQYDRYVELRESLLIAISSVTRLGDLPLSMTRLQTLQQPTESEEIQSDNHRRAYRDYSLLKNQLLPMSTEQGSVTQEKTFLTTTLARQQKSMHALLNRLGHESHLLPSYPILVGQARFQNAAKALSRTFKHEANPFSTPEEDEAISKGRAWIFAGEASREVTRDAVHKNVEAGGAAIEESKKTLAKLQALLGYHLPSNQLEEADLGCDDSFEEEDIWTAGTDRVKEQDSPSSQRRYGKDDDGTVGPWRAINGEVGVIGGTG